MAWVAGGGGRRIEVVTAGKEGHAAGQHLLQLCTLLCIGTTLGWGEVESGS